MTATIQRPPITDRFAHELRLLAERDATQGTPVPPGWALSAPSVRDFVLGDGGQITPKFVGSRAQIERCIVTLATNRGLMLIGEPGTAKSLLSELLAAAVSGDTTLTIQGSTATTEDSITYSWNYALLLSEGPTQRALVPAAIHRGMTHGRVVRFEELTRCAQEVQDSLLSVLAERYLAIPELDGAQRSLYAAPGFTVIATANTRDRGVNEMSAALKRRFNFETIGPIADPELEIDLVRRESAALLAASGVPAALPRDLTAVLVQLFRELREGEADGVGLERLSTTMSTAEAVGTAMTAALEAAYFTGAPPTGAHLASALVGTALKDDDHDASRIRAYLERHVRGREGIWREIYAQRHLFTQGERHD